MGGRGYASVFGFYASEAGVYASPALDPAVMREPGIPPSEVIASFSLLIASFFHLLRLFTP